LKAAKLNCHSIYNNLLRLRSITECIEKDGAGFADDEVRQDIKMTLENLKFEFEKLDTGLDHELT
jgi:hypothetical protein